MRRLDAFSLSSNGGPGWLQLDRGRLRQRQVLDRNRTDLRLLGHRQQSVTSLIALQLGMAPFCEGLHLEEKICVPKQPHRLEYVPSEARRLSGLIAFRSTERGKICNRNGAGVTSVGRFVQIVLQKSFCTGDQKFYGLQARLSCKDVRDLIASR